MGRWESTDGKSQRRGAEPTGRMRDEKLHGIVARRSFRSQKAKKNLTFRALLEVEMSKKCAPLWREAHVEVKMSKNTSGSERFGRLRCRKSARSCGAKHISKSTCTKHTPFSVHFLKLGCGFVWQAQGILHPAKNDQDVRVS